MMTGDASKPGKGLPPWLDSAGKVRVPEAAGKGDETPPGTALDYARRYAALGWKVFPCHGITAGACACGDAVCKSPGKHPLTPHGVKDATSDPEAITRWWRQWPEANIAIACGETSGIVVMDVDPRNGGEESLEQLREAGPVPDDCHAQTGGGGWHFVFRYPGADCRFPRLRGIDFQSDGKYVIVEPSMHLTGTAYAWEASSDPLDDETEIPELPAHLIAPASGAGRAPAAPEDAEWVDPRTISELRSALNALDADDYATWIECGHRLKGLGVTGRELWLSWSQQSEKWRPEDARRWTTFEGARTGYQAIFSTAQAQGWLNPASREARHESRREADERIIGPAHAQEADHSLFVRADAFAAEIRPVDWLIRGYLEKDCIAQLFGSSGAGKSFLAIDWALSVATGRPWNGKRTHQAGVIYIAGEGQNGLARRVQAWTRHHQISLKDQPIYFSKRPIELLNRTTAHETYLEIERIRSEPANKSAPIGLIVIDTLARNFGLGDENATKDMTTYINHLTAYLQEPFDATILIIHHSGHRTTERARGASSLPAALDINYQLIKDETIAKLTNSKMKDGDEPEPVTLGFTIVDLGVTDEEGEPVTSCVLDPVDISAMTRTLGLGKKQQSLLDLIDDLTEETGSPEVHLDTLKREAMARGIYARSSMTNLKKAVESLFDRELLEKNGDFVKKCIYDNDLQE